MSRPALLTLSLSLVALLAVPLTGCSPSPLTWTSTTVGCENFDFDNPGEPSLSATANGSNVVVQFGPVLQASDAEFAPELAVNGKEIQISEYWTEGEEVDFCFTPEVTLKNASGELQIYWFRGDDNVAFDNLTVQAD
jgi:hypothetical protein